MTTKVYVKDNGEAVIPAQILKAFGALPGNAIVIDIHWPSNGAELLPEIPPAKTVQDFLDEFEDKYGTSSKDFFDRWQQGKIEDIPEFNAWAGYYQTKLLLEKDGLDSAETTFKLHKSLEYVRE